MKKPRIVAIVMAPQTLKLPDLQEIITGAASNNTGTKRTLWPISEAGVDGTTPVHSGISETYTPSLSDNIGTRINGINITPTPYPSEVSITHAAPPQWWPLDP